MNLRDKILTADDIQKEIVPVAEWGVEVEVRSMTGEARAELMQNCMMQDPTQPNNPKAKTMDMKKAYPFIVVACTCDPKSGEPVFTMDDAEALMKKNAGPIEKLALAGLRVSGLEEEAVDKSGKPSS